jgi:chemotaxis protein MotB
MVGQSNVAPVIIIKRKKIIKASGHHGGAWKVAYADFVTAMMAFFMLMWLLNATTEKQRKGISDYFNPTIPINRISGGGTGAFGGDSIFSEETLAKSGTGAVNKSPTEQEKAKGSTGADASKETAAKDEVERLADAVVKALIARGGESQTMERLLRHVITRVTDEGLVIEVFDTADMPLFDENTIVATSGAGEIAKLLADLLKISTNQIAVEGHVRSYPITLIKDPTWDLSAGRAQVFRSILESNGMLTTRIDRVAGHSNRKPAIADPTVIRNNRIEVILLRSDR